MNQLINFLGISKKKGLHLNSCHSANAFRPLDAAARRAAQYRSALYRILAGDVPKAFAGRQMSCLPLTVGTQRACWRVCHPNPMRVFLQEIVSCGGRAGAASRADTLNPTLPWPASVWGGFNYPSRPRPRPLGPRLTIKNSQPWPPPPR